MVCVSISEASSPGLYPRGQVTLYKPTRYSRPYLLSRLNVSHAQKPEHSAYREPGKATKRFLTAYLLKTPPATRPTQTDATSVRIRKWIYRYLELLPIKRLTESQGALARRWIRNSLISPRMTKSTHSEATFALARKWICECISNHTQCCVDSNLTFAPPTRVIDVGPPDGSQDPHLYITTAEDRTMRYMTLSHSWGGAEILTLTQKSYEQMLTGFPISILPRTFQDAIEVCRRLNQRYLWIDSLCIFQQDHDGWHREAPKVKDVYQNSICTIAAVRAVNSFAGLFVHRETSCKLPTEVDLTASRDTSYHRGSACRDIIAPLDCRAWALQERLLSPRTLRFEKWGISWECRELRADERCIESIPLSELEYREAKLKEVFAQIQQCSLTATASEKERNFFSRAWHEIVKTYSGLGLTYSSDKLVAISGVTDEIRICTGLTYYYGIWSSPFDQGLFLSELLWSAPYPRSSRQPNRHPIGSEESCYGRTMRAPTFSWAAIDGPVDYRIAFHGCLYDRMESIYTDVMRWGGNHGLETLNFFSASGEHILNMKMWNSDPRSESSTPKPISRKRAEIMVLNVHDPAVPAIGTDYVPSTANEVDYRSTLIARLNFPASSEIPPSILLKGPLLQIDSTKTRNSNGDLVWSHPFASKECNIAPQQATSGKRPPSSWPSANNEDWFHVDVAKIEFYQRVVCSGYTASVLLDGKASSTNVGMLLG